MQGKRVVGVAIAVAGLATGAEAAWAGGNWYRVQYEQRITSADRSALDAAGAASVQYVHRNAYVAWLDRTSAARVRRAARVGTVGRVQPSDKLDAGIRRGRGRGRRLVALVRAGRAGAVVREHATVAAVDRALGTPGLRRILLTGTGATARRLAARPGVLYVGPAPRGLLPEDEGTAQIQAGKLSDANRPTPGYEAWLRPLGLSGDGVKVSIVDTGVDELHPDLAGRVQKDRDYTPAPEPLDTFGHGTHVGGIVAGSGVAMRAQGGARDNAGFLYGLGVAPGARLLDQNAIGTTVLEWPPSYGFDVLTRDALRSGAAVWNASWHTGEGTGAGYIQTAREMDALVRDGDRGTPGAQPFTMVFSAGNAGDPRLIGIEPYQPRLESMTSPKEAKNIITVASTRSQRSAGTIDQVSNFSSRGPARDGRFLPTVAAPGQTVASTRALPASAVCNQPPTDGNSFALYGLCSGTSMAAPHVTGAVALLTEWWRARNRGVDPSPAMSKALLVNTATDMGGADAPNPHEGWGRVNLGNLFDPSVHRQYFDQQRALGEPGQQRQMPFKVADPARPLKVTVAWTDAPGTPGPDPTTAALVNDLDLVVTAPDGTVYRGNVLAAGASESGGRPDRLNNLEQVHVPQPAAGAWHVAVIAYNVPGDGVPDHGDATDQDFALVVSNAVRPSGRP